MSKPFPKVPPAVVNALKKQFKPIPPRRGESHEDMLLRAGQQEVVNFLEHKMKE